MNPFEMVVVIVLIVMVARVAKHRATLRSSYGPANDLEIERLRDQVILLDRRVQTLEKLATDPARRLADEIDALKHR